MIWKSKGFFSCKGELSVYSTYFQNASDSVSTWLEWGFS